MVKTILKYSCLAGAASLMASPAFAQEAPAHSVFILNSLLFLMSGFLVMFMACGFCMLEAGLVRAKNTTMQLTKNVALFSLAAIGYYLIGYNLMYPLGTWSVEGVLSGVYSSRWPCLRRLAWRRIRSTTFAMRQPDQISSFS